MAEAEFSSREFDAYIQIPASTTFSPGYFAQLTLAQAAALVQNRQLPQIMSQNSYSRHRFICDVPPQAAQMVGYGESIPCSADLSKISRDMQEAFKCGGRAVEIQFRGSDQVHVYHLAKIRLIVAVNNYYNYFHDVHELLQHIEKATLLQPALLEEFKNCRFTERLAGFRVSNPELYTLTCVLREEWLTEDVVNARLEMLYYRRAAHTPDESPSHLLLPTRFLADLRVLRDSGASNYSPEVTALRERIEHGDVDRISIFNWSHNHFTVVRKDYGRELELGDSLHQAAEADILPLLRWAFSGLEGFEPPAKADTIRLGKIDKQGHGGRAAGSCGVAACNFAEVEMGFHTRRWKATAAADFRNMLLQELIVYHLIARRKGSAHGGWTEFCLPKDPTDNGTPHNHAVGFVDFNLYKLVENSNHPIFDWLEAMQQQWQIFPDQVYFDLLLDISPSQSPTKVPPLDKLATMDLDAPLEILPCNAKQPKAVDVMDISDSDDNKWPLPRPTTPPREPSSVIDLSLDTPNNQRPITPPPQRKKEESPILIDLSPARPSTKRKLQSGTQNSPISLISPPRPRPTINRRDPEPPPPPPNRSITVLPGNIRIGSTFESLQEAESAIYSWQESEGHKWTRTKTKNFENGQIRYVTLSCNRARTAKVTHKADIDPSLHRKGASARVDCPAHINISCNPFPVWRINSMNTTHQGHERSIPAGGHAQRPPTAEVSSLISKFAPDFGRPAIRKILKAALPNSRIEDRQLTNAINKERTHAREVIAAMGGDFAAVCKSLEEERHADPRWYYALQLDTENVFQTIFWQSPTQAELSNRFTDILINDNSYNRNDKQYPLSIGIAIDLQGKSRNIWYALQLREDAETHEWIFQQHLKVSRNEHPEVVISDRAQALIAAVARVFVFSLHLFCLHHLSTNIDSNLPRKLGDQWSVFKPEFWACYRSVSPSEFDRKWNALKERFPAARDYLQELYDCRDRWGWACTTFTAGIRTNGRVEAENRITKQLGLGPKKMIFQAFKLLNSRTQDQHDNKLIRIRDSARVRHPGPIEELYKDILDQLRQYAGPYALQTTYKQMELSVGYLAVQLQRPPEYRRWSDYIVAVNHEAGYEWHSEEAGSTRHDFTNDHPYISLEFLLKILRDQGATHILALLPDGRYACDCCMGTNLGIICRHYLIAWSRIPGLPFHISLIRARWLQDTNLDFSAIAPVTRRQQTSQTYSFTAISLPDNRRISNPLSGHPLQNRQTPPPPSQTLNRREIHAQVQANLASLSRGIQTQEQLDDLNAAIQNLQRNREQSEMGVRDPPTFTGKGCPLMQRFTGVTEGAPHGGGGARSLGRPRAPPRCSKCGGTGHNRVTCQNA